MTTHYEKIQALGNRMASNLETMGVSASFSDGGLTLADKILEIQRGFTDGLLLYADKDIIQTGDTVNLYALLLEDGKAVSGETIFFDGILTPTRVTLQEAEYYLTTKYDVITIPEGTVLYLDSARSIQLTHPIGENYFSLVSQNHVIDTGTDFSMNNGILTYTDSNNNTKTIDLTQGYDWSSIYPNSAECVIDDYSYRAVTGSNGVASVSYTGKGAGLLNIKAFTSNRIIQSEIFVVEDCLKYDTEVLSSKSYNIGLNDMNFYLEFIVHPTASTGATAYINIKDNDNNTLSIGDMYNNANCGVNWTGGTFYGKQITVDTDTKITLRRTGTSMVLTVNETTYNITGMNITCNTLTNAVISNNQIKQFKIYPI